MPPLHSVSPLSSKAGFSPTYLRNATAYGVSPRLRVDVVVNNLVGYAHTTRQILMQSDGTPWRPLVHVQDIARAFLAVLEAPRELVHDAAFNVGASSENYRIREIAEIASEAMPGTRIAFAEGSGLVQQALRCPQGAHDIRGDTTGKARAPGSRRGNAGSGDRFDGRAASFSV